MGFFDTLLTAIAPERAVKRVAAQTAIRAINSGYSNYGASLHKKSMRGWMWHGGSPKEDIEDNLRVLRERSRDAYMGVPLATGAIKTMKNWTSSLQERHSVVKAKISRSTFSILNFRPTSAMTRMWIRWLQRLRLFWSRQQVGALIRWKNLKWWT